MTDQKIIIQYCGVDLVPAEDIRDDGLSYRIIVVENGKSRVLWTGGMFSEKEFERRNKKIF